jgi:ubiquinone/menaquinone biosynthesis C-methylase UbiE
MQNFKDKNSAIERIKTRKKVIIELGSGNSQKRGIAIDKLNLSNTDIVADLEEGLSFLNDNSVDEIYANSLLEHIKNFDLLMKEIHRVLKNKGTFYCFVPHFSNPYFYSDPTHVRFFGYYNFYYYGDKKSMDKLKRKVPSFYSDIKFEIVSQKVTFNSPFKIQKKILKIFEIIINKNIFLQEFYERHLSSSIKCYGIRAILKVNK